MKPAHRTTCIPEKLAWRWGWFTMFVGVLIGMAGTGIVIELVAL